jgi:hypothetical protein
MEGKAWPQDLDKPKCQQLGKTVGLILRMCEPTFGSGRVVMWDSGFCALKGIVELKKRGAHSSALTKKRRCGPKRVPGDAVKEHFDNKPVGSAGAWGGALDEVPFCLFGMKEPDCVMMLMSACGALERASTPNR